jgi:hypothetical protein
MRACVHVRTRVKAAISKAITIEDWTSSPYKLSLAHKKAGGGGGGGGEGGGVSSPKPQAPSRRERKASKGGGGGGETLPQSPTKGKAASQGAQWGGVKGFRRLPSSEEVVVCISASLQLYWVEARDLLLRARTDLGDEPLSC